MDSWQTQLANSPSGWLVLRLSQRSKFFCPEKISIKWLALASVHWKGELRHHAMERLASLMFPSPASQGLHGNHSSHGSLMTASVIAENMDYLMCGKSYQTGFPPGSEPGKKQDKVHKLSTFQWPLTQERKNQTHSRNTRGCGPMASLPWSTQPQPLNIIAIPTATPTAATAGPVLPDQSFLRQTNSIYHFC